MEIQINNDILDDELVMINMEELEENDFGKIIKMLTKEYASDNVEAIAKLKEYAENNGIEIKKVLDIK